MELDSIILSRIQFAANITFHIMFPSITIALGWILLFFKIRFNMTKDEAWMKAYFFFTKVFALSFLHRCGEWGDHVIPIWDKLARLYGNRRKYCRPTARL